MTTAPATSRAPGREGTILPPPGQEDDAGGGAGQLDRERAEEPDPRVDADIRSAQAHLAGLGLPVGPVDGIDGPRTRRGLCAWRRLDGASAHRGPLAAGELARILATPGLPAAAPGPGLLVDRTCQTVQYRHGGSWLGVVEASTGAGGLPLPGEYVIQRTRAGWHTSTLYPADQPNMYNTLYFHGAIAIHGAWAVPTHPASSGCVRVTPSSADVLFARYTVGDPVSVVGTY